MSDNLGFKVDFTGNGSDSFPILVEDTYQVAFAGMESLGLLPKFKQNPTDQDEFVEKVCFYFYSAEEELTDGSTARVVLRSKPMTTSGHVKSSLTAAFLAILGGKPDPEVIGKEGVISAGELAEKLKGNNVQVSVVHSIDGRYANIASISPVSSKNRKEINLEGYVKPQKKEGNGESSIQIDDDKIPF